MSSIPVAIFRFSDNNFKRLYRKNGSLLSIVGCISEMVVKFRTFWKKGEYPSLIITEINGSDRDNYLSV